MFFQPPALPHRVRRGWGLVGRDSRLNLSLVPRSRYVVPPTQHFWEYSQAQPRLGKAPSPSTMPGKKDILHVEKELSVKARCLRKQPK